MSETISMEKIRTNAAQTGGGRRTWNNRKKIRLSDTNGNGNEPSLGCSSSSSSSNYSDDMDVVRNAVLESLMKSAHAASKTNASILSISKNVPPGRDDDGKTVTTVDSYRATKSTRPAASDEEKIRTDVKIVRIKTLDSEESKLLLIVDVLDKNPFRIELNSNTKRDEESGKCITVDIEALKRGECPKEIRNLCTKVRSRRIYKLPDELMKKFDQKGLKVFEWHSFNRPDEVIKLLLDDSGATTDGAANAAAPPDVRKKMIIGFRKRSTNSEDEPATKIRRTGTSEVKVLSRGIRKARMAAEQRSRNRILQKLLKEYNMTGVWDANQTKINRLVRSHLDSRAKEANERTQNRRKELDDISAVTNVAAGVTSSTSRQLKWKIVKENLSGGIAVAQRRDRLEAANVLLNDDNVASVVNNSADVSAIDGNSDALNNSNNDDNDSKAKKKNRCALCRKKVGLTGFECRCGGLYCGIHRYSDKHNCTFDYRQLGAQEIRRNNPVVVGEKIQKI